MGYSYSAPSPGIVVVTAPNSSGGNNREFFWARQGHIEADQTVCATFASGQGIDQQGIVIRRLNARKSAECRVRPESFGPSRGLPMSVQNRPGLDEM
jgi:hypothetical protein